eukprot:TRINITY_DN9931_c0_g1_i1.p1 TRINITY_DN9931_c0_g1~~TRINITY_DN9931_c0_g1_i1.p1  ORF type:complete len:405 (-),score=48.99 TRINITY_DN9931_c0_g1_i1:50-1198(-)
MAAHTAAHVARQGHQLTASRVVFVGVLAQFCCCPVDAWSPLGHERIARIAQELLQGKKRDQIRTMQHGDLVDLSIWEKNMTQLFPDTDVLHWHHQNPEWTCMSRLGDKEGHIRCDGHGAEAGSLFCALAYFFESFSHNKIMEAYPAPHEPINTPKSLLALGKVPATYLKPSSYLRWLGILIGDLHQPLHWMRDHDYGRKVTVKWENKEYSLLSFWEDFLPSQVTSPIPAMEVLEAKYKERVVDWKHKVPTELFREWGMETAEHVCEVYTKMEKNHADGSRGIDPVVHLTQDMYTQWRRMYEDRTVMAGQRLAFVLLDILDHKKHHHAHQEGRGLHLRAALKKRWRQNFLVNLGIGCVNIPLLLLGFRLHAGGTMSRPPSSKH